MKPINNFNIFQLSCAALT